MKAFLILTLASFGFAVGQVTDCPPPEILHPCYCLEAPSFTNIFCTDITEEFNLKQVFDRASEFVDNDAVFSGLMITNTPIVHVEEGTIEHLKFHIIIIIAENPNLEYISPKAFGATRNFTGQLSLTENNIRNEAPYERDFFEMVNGFEKLYNLYVTDNSLSSIPDHAFQNLHNLESVSLARNRISRIGSNVFPSDAPLNDIYFWGNSIPSEGHPVDAFNGVGEQTAVHLECNHMEFLEQRSFQTLLDLAGDVTIGGANCEDSAPSPPQTFHCYGRADWICDNGATYRPKLRGFPCKNETGFVDVWDYCAGRNGTLPVSVALNS